MKLLILSDIHGNKSAFSQVIKYIKDVQPDAVAFLGDLIDYCPHSNEVVKMIQELGLPFLCNIWGNHEDAIMNDHYNRFSSQRGAESSRYTKSILTEETLAYLSGKMQKEGKQEFSVDGKKYLAVHGSLSDFYWGKFDLSKNLSSYADYDVVLMGHSHRPFFYEAFFPCDNPMTRNQKKTIFINPGSVGQPRNINRNSQFAIFDTETEECALIKLPYAISEEQKDFSDKIDSFYKTRLETGI